jgi:hypothetical protein
VNLQTLQICYATLAFYFLLDILKQKRLNHEACEIRPSSHEANLVIKAVQNIWAKILLACKSRTNPQLGNNETVPPTLASSPEQPTEETRRRTRSDVAVM